MQCMMNCQPQNRKRRNKQFPVWRTDKIPLGTKGRTSILSYREYRASWVTSFPVSRRKLLDRECCVTSFRQGGYTTLCRLCGYPLWTCWRQTDVYKRQEVSLRQSLMLWDEPCCRYPSAAFESRGCISCLLYTSPAAPPSGGCRKGVLFSSLRYRAASDP